MNARSIPASAAERAAQAASQQAARRVIGVASVLALFGRNRAVADTVGEISLWQAPENIGDHRGDLELTEPA